MPPLPGADTAVLLKHGALRPRLHTIDMRVRDDDSAIES